MMKREVLSFAELEQKIKKNKEIGNRNIAYLPIGCVEQHGPFLPLETDSLVATAIADSLCDAMSKKNYWGYVFPTVHYTPCQSSANFAGTVSVADEYFRAYVRQVAKSIMRTPFDVLVLVSGHAGADTGLKDIGYWQVYEQFELDAQIIRPVAVLSLFECAPDLEIHFKQKPGRHADWRELLFLYRIMGEEFFDQERQEGLKKFCDENQFSIIPSMIYGIPMEYRSTAGVMGEPLPSVSSNWAVLAEEIWDYTLQHITDKLHKQLEDFGKEWGER